MTDEYDLYFVGARVKDIDPGLSVEWDRDRKRHAVYFTNQYGIKELVMWNPFGKLDARLLTHIRRIDTARGGYDPVKQVNERNEQIRRSAQKSVDNDAWEAAKESCKAIQYDI